MCNPAQGQLCTDKRRSHEMHKQEAFQGMRAYHMSEIYHKQDTISVIKSTLTSIITVDGAIIAALLAGKLHPLAAVSGAIIVVIAVIISIRELTQITNKKIHKDHTRYEDYRNDYVKETTILGLKDDESHWHRSEDRALSGYSKTQEIISVFENIVIGVSIIGLFLTGMICVFM